MPSHFPKKKNKLFNHFNKYNKMKNILLALLLVSLVSCTTKPTLQKYFVENSESSDFIQVDLASSFINTDKLSLSSEEKEALNSFDKLNILAFKNDSLDPSKLGKEATEVKNILKDGNYEQLMKFGNSKQGASVYMLGNEDKIDEFVLYGSEASGFVVARVLGDNMTPNTVLNLIEVIKKADLDMEQLKPLKDALIKK